MRDDEPIPEMTVVIKDLDRCEVEGCRKRPVFGCLCVDHCGTVRPSQVEGGGHSRGNVDYAELDKRVKELSRIKSEKKVVEKTSMNYVDQRGNKSLGDY